MPALKAFRPSRRESPLNKFRVPPCSFINCLVTAPMEPEPSVAVLSCKRVLIESKGAVMAEATNAAAIADAELLTPAKTESSNINGRKREGNNSSLKPS